MTNSSKSQSKIEATSTQAKPGADHRRLDVFVGTWDMEGQQHAGMFGPAAKVKCTETFEWLPGGLFLIHRLHGQVGNDEMACIEIFEVDAASHGYVLHTFFNDGTKQQWQAREDNGVWIIFSERELAGKTWKLRCTTRLEDAGNTRTGKWERSADGSRWETFWDVKAKKVG